MAAITKRRPIRKTSRPDGSRFRREPALPLNERHQRAAFEYRAGRPIEQVLPIDTGHQGRQGVDDRGGRIGRLAGPPRRLDRCWLQREPVGRIGAEREQVRLRADTRELGEPTHFHRNQSGEGLQVDFGRLNAARQIDHAQHCLPLVAAQVGHDFPIRTADEFQSTAAEHAVLLAHRDQPLAPVQRRKRITLLCLDVDRLVAVDRILNRRREQPRRIGARESTVAVAAPLHRRSHPVAIAKIDVVAHADFVAVVQDRRARE
jgi:hypothetical protein